MSLISVPEMGRKYKYFPLPPGGLLFKLLIICIGKKCSLCEKVLLKRLFREKISRLPLGRFTCKRIDCFACRIKMLENNSFGVGKSLFTFFSQKSLLQQSVKNFFAKDDISCWEGMSFCKENRSSSQLRPSRVSGVCDSVGCVCFSGMRGEGVISIVGRQYGIGDWVTK